MAGWGEGARNIEFFIVHGLDKRTVPQWTASASAIHIHGRTAKHPPPPKYRQHKRSTTYPNPLMILHWNIYPAWKDRVSIKNYRSRLTKVQGWIQNSHWEDSVCPYKDAIFYLESGNLKEWWGEGTGEEEKFKSRVKSAGDDGFLANSGLSYPVAKEAVNRVNKVRCLPSWTPKQSANWLHFSLSVDCFNIIIDLACFNLGL